MPKRGWKRFHFQATTEPYARSLICMGMVELGGASTIV